MNFNYFNERRLLKQCADDKPAAQERFAHLSYLNQVYRTASEMNADWNNVLSDTELDALCKVWVARIYKAYGTLPHVRTNLYKRIHEYVLAAFLVYVRDL